MSVIGYSEADFATLRTENKLYIDRTAYIQTMENQSNKNVIFVRPRRFGKSLWLSILHYYYGVEHKDKFDMLFGDLDIGKHPTPLRNSYIVLRMQFAGIDVETDESTYSGFRNNVMTGIIDCMKVYTAYFSQEEMSKIEALDTPASMIQLFFSLYKGKNIPYKLYILIDEYDRFASKLHNFDKEQFLGGVEIASFIRQFYMMIKNSANEGTMNRFFATGVFPLMIGDFNISTNLSEELRFHDLMGFSQSEVMGVLKQIGISKKDITNIITDLKNDSDGYLFNEEAPKRLYNFDMLLPILVNYKENYPILYNILKSYNSKSYTNIDEISHIQDEQSEFFPILKQLDTEGVLSAELADFLNLEKSFTTDDFINLLYFTGHITIQDEADGIWRFKIPKMQNTYQSESMVTDFGRA